MNETERLHSLLLLSAMLETIGRVERDFAKLKESAEEWRKDFVDFQHSAPASAPVDPLPQTGPEGAGVGAGYDRRRERHG